MHRWIMVQDQSIIVLCKNKSGIVWKYFLGMDLWCYVVWFPYFLCHGCTPGGGGQLHLLLHPMCGLGT